MRLFLLFLYFAGQFLRAASFPSDSLSAPEKQLPLPGEVFQVDGHIAFVISAKTNLVRRSMPWVWYAPTLPGLPGPEEKWMFDQFLDAGIAVAGIDVGESFGSPTGCRLFTAFFTEMTRQRSYSSKPVLLGRSRGGLMTLSWAAENPSLVGAFAGIYPVCNLASYPGVARAADAYQLTPTELERRLAEFNPIDRLAPLAKHAVPLFAIHGDVDTLVPLELNSGLVDERYAALGGSMQLIIPAGQGHSMWPGYFQNQALVDFVKQHARPRINVLSPSEYQVFQRMSKPSGILKIQGNLTGFPTRTLVLEARLIVDGHPGEWRRISLSRDRRTFETNWSSPAGGWHRFEVRARSGADVLTDTAIEHVGIGEVFVIAGQSNSANHGAEKQKSSTGLVSTFDGQRWQLAHDPQPGASGSGGSFIPPFGDALVDRFHVPIGIVACGIGATSVREWLPKGATFPNPPTLTGNVQMNAKGEWESRGAIFLSFVERMKRLGQHGFRAVLWHQGESDANQRDPTRTYPGNLYRKSLEQLIRKSRQEIGWEAPWFVAQVSYHGPGDEGSSDIRAAQASLWKRGIALEGPDSDALQSEFRDDDGKGVHFNGVGLREHAARWADKVAPWVMQRLK